MQIYDAVKNEFSFEIPADGEVTHSQKLKIHEVISSLRGPLRDLLNDGIRVRERQHQKYTEPKPVNIEQQLAAERADLVAGLHMVREYCLTITARGIATNAIIPPKEWDDLLNDVVPLAKMARELRRTHRRLKMR
jgi:hypothetical protein